MLSLVNIILSVNMPNEKIVPVYFGQDSALYGCYHLPVESHNSSAVLICQPIGHEYERCHRAMRQLAVQSVRKGLAAMRFDYFGTGDSAGNSDEISLSQMRHDIQQAIEACSSRTRAKHLTLIGLRLGATMAAQVACCQDEIDSLVLYAPVFDGETLLHEWQHEQLTFDGKHSHKSRQAGAEEILGFPVPEIFSKELANKFLPTVSSSSLKRVLILLNEDEMQSAALSEWQEMFESHGVVVNVEAIENIAIWKREPMEAIVPIKAIRRIVQWVIEN